MECHQTCKYFREPSVSKLLGIQVVHSKMSVFDTQVVNLNWQPNTFGTTPGRLQVVERTVHLVWWFALPCSSVCWSFATCSLLHNGWCYLPRGFTKKNGDLTNKNGGVIVRHLFAMVHPNIPHASDLGHGNHQPVQVHLRGHERNANSEAGWWFQHFFYFPKYMG